MFKKRTRCLKILHFLGDWLNFQEKRAPLALQLLYF